MHSAAKTTFDPCVHGFPFDNSFDAVLWDARAIGPIRLPRVSFGGLCGGMTFAALDNYFADRPGPRSCGEFPGGEDSPGGRAPAVGSVLHELIYRRHLASVGLTPAVVGLPLPGGRARVVPTHPENLLRYPYLRAAPERLRRRENRQSLASLRSWLGEGYPMPLGLVSGDALTHSHQVVAYGFTDGVHASLVQLYDCRYPDRTAQLAVAEDGSSCILTLDGRPPQEWRAFFISRYAPAAGVPLRGRRMSVPAAEDAS
ncbi:hypothetical protein SAMN05444157_3290 [Frankineae bacterium MT45]|nr:hypothetical protein SAMN05444157_3290 [Frankineae bacterium MT45]